MTLMDSVKSTIVSVWFAFEQRHMIAHLPGLLASSFSCLYPSHSLNVDRNDSVWYCRIPWTVSADFLLVVLQSSVIFN
jgi:hypothetical protein